MKRVHTSHTHIKKQQGFCCSDKQSEGERGRGEENQSVTLDRKRMGLDSTHQNRVGKGTGLGVC